MYKGKNILVLDVETQRSFKEVGGKSNLHKLKISTVGTYDYLSDRCYAFEEREMLDLDKRLQDVGIVIGFNVRRFDMQVLQPYLFRPVEQIPVLDLLDAIEKDRGHRASLDSVAAPTLKQHKIGHGTDAILMFQQNRMEELKRYCLEDVRITREIYEFGCREGKILFTSGWDYKTYEIPVRWKQETEELLGGTTAAPSQNFPTSLF